MQRQAVETHQRKTRYRAKKLKPKNSMPSENRSRDFDTEAIVQPPGEKLSESKVEKTLNNFGHKSLICKSCGKEGVPLVTFASKFDVELRRFLGLTKSYFEVFVGRVLTRGNILLWII